MNTNFKGQSTKFKAQLCMIGTEGEIRTLEANLEDSHVSSYITSA